MISSNNGEVRLSGTTTVLMTDLSMIVRAINEMLIEDVGEECAKKMIDKAVELGMMDEDMVEQKAKEKMNETAMTADELIALLKCFRESLDR